MVRRSARAMQWLLVLAISLGLAAAARAQVIGLQPTPIGVYTWNPTSQEWDQLTGTGTSNPLATTPQAFAFYVWNPSLGQWVPCTDMTTCFSGNTQSLAGDANGPFAANTVNGLHFGAAAFTLSPSTPPSASLPVLGYISPGVLGGIAGGSGDVSSVSNSDSTLTISPTTGAVVASLNTANANTWSATQTFSNGISVTGGGTPGITTPDVAYAGSTSGMVTITAPAVAGTQTIAWPAASGTVALTSQLAYLPLTGGTLTGPLTGTTVSTTTSVTTPSLINSGIASGAIVAGGGSSPQAAATSAQIVAALNTSPGSTTLSNLLLPSPQVYNPNAPFLGFSTSNGGTNVGGITLEYPEDFWFGNGTPGDLSGELSGAILNAMSGFELNNAAPLGHCLVGNGGEYVDGGCAIMGVSLADYSASDLPVSYGNVTSGSNSVTVVDASSWTNGQGIFIPAIATTAAYPANGVVCDNVTVSGNTITMFNADGSACDASWTASGNSLPIFHYDMTHGAISSGGNTLTVSSAATFSSGQGILVAGAGTSGADLICPVISVSGTIITLFQANGSTACNAGTTVATAQVFHDDTLALKNALAAGNYVGVPSGAYFLSSEVDIAQATTLYGAGPQQSAFLSMENSIHTLVADSSGIVVRDLGVYQPDTLTPTGGDLLDDCNVAATGQCFNNTFTDLMLYRGWNAFAVYGSTLQGAFSESTIHAPINAGVYIDDPGQGDLNFSTLQISNCNSSCTTGTYGLLIDAADTNTFNAIKLNSFVHNLWLTGNLGAIDHQRFDNISFEVGSTSLGSAVQALSSNAVFGIQFTGGETEDTLLIGNGVLQTQIDGLRFYTFGQTYTSVLDVAGQNTMVLGNSMEDCAGDCIRLESTAAYTVVTGNNMYGGTAYGINNLAPSSQSNSFLNNESTIASNGFVGALLSGGAVSGPIVGTGTAAYTLGTSTVVGTGATVATSTGHVADGLSGEIHLVTGTGITAAGTMFIVTLPITRTYNVNCVFSPNTGAGSFMSGPSTTSTFSISTNAELIASTNYYFDYWCGGN